MGTTTKIEWCDHTFNPWRGCTHATDDAGAEHPACAHCYAEAMSKRNPDLLGKWGDDGTRVVAGERQWALPAQWNAAAAAAGERRRVFCASLADVFEDWGGLMRGSKGGVLHRGDAWASHKPFVEVNDVYVGRSLARMADVRNRLFETIDSTPWLDWLLLTKRPENVRRMWPDIGRATDAAGGPFSESIDELRRRGLWNGPQRANVWLGTSVSDQATADVWLPRLLECRDLAPVLFLSVEPLLGPIDFTDGPANPAESQMGDWSTLDEIDWVIVGGESGPHARPMHPQWARSLRDQCAASKTAYFFKQWGEWLPRSHASQATREAYPTWDLLSLDGTRYGAATAWNGHDDEPHDGDHEAAMYRVGKAKAGRLLDGVEWSEFPAVALTSDL